MATVQWDCGSNSRYRCGVGGKYDLRVLDVAPSGVKHPPVNCDVCKERSLDGFRWKCSACYDYDLCTSCYMAGQHDLDHAFKRYGGNYSFIARMPPRAGMDKVEAKGLFLGAEVVRGPDWAWEEQDGGSGNPGVIVEVKGWSSKGSGRTTARSAARVKWKADGSINKYRIGHTGLVDLKCIVASSGGHYYQHHLPVLGAPIPPADPRALSSGDYVRVELELEVFQIMQQGHGGWNPSMATLKDKLGVVHSTAETDPGIIKVRYGSDIWKVNQDAVVKADMSHLEPGTVVRVMDDMAEMKKLQHGWGDWSDPMENIMGHVGVIKGLAHFGAVVKLNGRKWVLNPLCLKPASREELSDTEEEGIAGKMEAIGEDILLHLRMLTLFGEENSEGLLFAAFLGDIAAISDYLRRFPNEVNAKGEGDKSAIHCAAIRNQIPTLNVLIEFGADVNIADEDGERALHFCASKDFEEAAKVLLEAGADLHLLNSHKVTPLIMAALKSCTNTLRVMVDFTKGQALCHQDEDGETPLHRAILARDVDCVRNFLTVGADPTLVNFHLNTSLHLAALGGYVDISKEIVLRHPECLNLCDDEQATPLHMAGFKDKLDVTRYFLQQAECNREAKTGNGHTPLHAAIIGGHSRIVECYLGYGLNVNAVDYGLNTPLHITLRLSEDIKPPSHETPALLKVQDLLGEMEGTAGLLPSVILACFLIHEGANLLPQNLLGVTALDGCPPNVASILTEFASRHGGKGTFHGSLDHSKTAETPPSPAPREESSPTHQPDVYKPAEENNAEESTRPTAQSVPLSPGPSVETEPLASSVEEHPLQSPDTQACDESQASTVSGTDSAAMPQTGMDSTGDDGEDSTAGGATVYECILCDSPVTIQFQPCGHSPLCELCGRKAKRCPECKTAVTRVVQLTTA